MSSDHQRLFSDYAAETISAEDFRLLNELLLNNKELRAEFLQYMNTCAFLEGAASYSESLFPDTEIEALLKQDETDSAKILRFPKWAIAVAACAMFALFLWPSRDLDSANSVSTRVIASHEAQMQNSEQVFTEGDEIKFADFELESGWVRLELPRGVIFDVYGPAKGRFENDTRFHLDSGRINVDVGPNGKGFTVVTANAEVVDLGTQFGIEVDEGFDARVAVFSGEVEVHSIDRQTSPRLLVEGEGVNVASTGESTRLMSIDIPNLTDFAPPSFVRSLRFDIRDNQTSESNLRYYGIINGGMREGAKVYTTHSSVRWNSPDGQPFPTALVGADLIQTFNNDRNDEELEIDLRVETAATVFVMFDQRYEPPTWLKEQFTETDDILISGPWKPVAIVHDILPDSSGKFHVHHRVWRAELSPNQTVKLGAAVNSQAREFKRAMYGIAVKAGNFSP
jgi:hypothetical protein